MQLSKSSLALIFIALITVAAISSFATYSLIPKTSAQKFLDIRIIPDGASLAVGVTQTFTAAIYNGTGPFQVTWYANSTFIGNGLSIDYSFKQSCKYIMLQANVKDSFGYTGSNIVFVYDPLSFSTTIEPGSMVLGYSAIIFGDSSIYYFKNGMKGSIDYSSADLSAVIQNCISTLPIGTAGRGSTIKIVNSPGTTYTTTSTILVDRPIMFVGDGAINTALTRIVSTVNGPVFNVIYGDCGFENLNLYGPSRTENSTGILVATGSAATVTMSNLYISNFKTGLWLDYVIQSYFNNIFANSNGIGIKITGNSYMNSFESGCANLNNIIGISLSGNSFYNKFDLMDLEVNNIAVQIRYNTEGNTFTNCWYESSDTWDFDLNETGGYARVQENSFINGHIGYANADKGGLKIVFGNGAYNNLIQTDRSWNDSIGTGTLIDNGVGNKIVTRDSIPSSAPIRFAVYDHPGTVTFALQDYPSGSIHTSQGSDGGLVEMTLPYAYPWTSTPSGTTYTCVVIGTSMVRVKPNPSDAFYLNGSKHADADYLYSNSIGSSITVVADGYNDWIITSLVGTWTFN